MAPRYHLLPRADPNQGCTKDTCDPSQSVYGYTPNLAATVIFLLIFALSGALYIAQGLKTRTWFFSSVMFTGCLSMTLGYAGKLILHSDPFSDPGFKLTVVLFTFSPAFYAAGIYYTLKHICLAFGAAFSRLRPQLYTSIFIGCDFLSIVLQAVGGGVASAAEDDAALRIGDRIMTAGLALQVATMLAFAALAADYAVAVRRNRHQLNPATAELRSSRRFKFFLAALSVSYLCILLRCAYRLAELSKGWGPQNDVLRDQGLFVGLDSVPCAVATVVLNVWHPGWCFPRMRQRGGVGGVAAKGLEMGSRSEDDEKVEV